MREGVVAVVQRSERVLVIERGASVPFPGVWCPISGKVEPGETQRDAVLREVREEAGLEVEPLCKVWECRSEGGDFWLHWWTARYLGGELRLDAREVAAARWLDARDFGALAPTFAVDRHFFAEVLPSL